MITIKEEKIKQDKLDNNILMEPCIVLKFLCNMICIHWYITKIITLQPIDKILKNYFLFHRIINAHVI